MPSNIESLFRQIQNVPQIPEVIKILIDQFNDPTIDLKAIALNVEKEPLLAAKVLRVVNSSYFGLTKKIDSISEAVVLIGMSQLRSLVIASGIVGAVPSIENFDAKHFWINSFHTASYAKWLASKTACDDDIAFTAGLINNLGIILIHLGQPKEAMKITQLIDKGHARAFVENMLLGYTSQEVSAELCRLWNFSDQLITPISQCEAPLLADQVSKSGCVVFVARYLSACKQSGTEQNIILEKMPTEVIEHLGLSAAFFEENIDELLSLESGLEAILD